MEGPTEAPATSPRRFEAIFDVEFAYVCRTLTRLGVRASDTEDAAQEVFIAVHRKFETFDQRRPIRPWLFAFAYRFASNYQQKAHVRKEVLDHEVEEHATKGTPEDAASEKQGRALIIAALAMVPLERRTTLVMHDIDGFTAPQIAESLNLPTNTVYSRIRIARAEFKKALIREQQRRGGA